MLFETIEMIYTFIPKEIFVIIMAGLIFLLYEFFKGIKDRWTNQKEKKYK